MFRWAVKKRYLDQNPAAESEDITREKHADHVRRLFPDVLNEKGAVDLAAVFNRSYVFGDDAATMETTRP
jgi:hypothetical protein